MDERTEVVPADGTRNSESAGSIGSIIMYT